MDFVNSIYSSKGILSGTSLQIFLKTFVQILELLFAFSCLQVDRLYNTSAILDGLRHAPLEGHGIFRSQFGCVCHGVFV